MKHLKNIITFKSVTIAFTIYVLLILTYGSIVFFVFRDARYELTQAGLFGEMFGAFNAFFTGLAFLVVGTALYFQIIDSRETKISNYNNQVENTFFNMLMILNQIIEFCQSKNYKGEKFVGREYFHNTFEQLQEDHNVKMTRTKNIIKSEFGELSSNKLAEKLRQPLEELYNKIFSRNGYNLGHYFRYLYNIFKYIKSSFPNNIDLQNKYINILQAQLSNDELCLLFYNVLSVHGRNSRGEDKFRTWLDEHNFFQNIDKSCIFEKCYTEYFPKTSFKCFKQIA